MPSLDQSVTLCTSPMPRTSKLKTGLVKVPVHFNVYYPEFVIKCLFGLVDIDILHHNNVLQQKTAELQVPWWWRLTKHLHIKQ